EDDDLLPDRLRCDERGRRLHVLVALAPGAERVPVHPRDLVARGGARDEENVVLVSERRHLQRDPRRGRAGEDLVALADQILAGGTRDERRDERDEKPLPPLLLHLAGPPIP